MPMFRRAGMREGGKPLPTSTSIFDFYGIKALLFEFGNDIFPGFKMPLYVMKLKTSKFKVLAFFCQ